VDLTPETLSKLERLAAGGFCIVPTPGVDRYFLIEKGDYYALVQRTPTGLGEVGSPGIMTPQGFAPLVQSDNECAFVCRSYRHAASPAQVASARDFFTQLKQALS
jgi:hypothetical protein